MKIHVLSVLVVFTAGLILLGQGPGSPGQRYVGSHSSVVSAAASHRHAPAIIRERHGRYATTHNWSGYAYSDAAGSVTDVKGSWIVPTLQCTSASPNGYAAFWVGIDGWASNTVEQIGIEADCVNGKPTYYAWYEFYPHPSYTVNSFQVKPTDTITAEVIAGKNGQFTASLAGGSNTTPFVITTKMPSAKLSSAEWIVEAPWSGGVLPLADFGTAYFGNGYTGVANTCFATVGGKAASIGLLNQNNVSQVTMVDKSGNYKATPSGLSTDGTSFADTWVTAGP
jgi:hypothetical protein